MPQATPELRDEWWPPDDQTGSDTAIHFLESQGFKLRRDWTWKAPAREPTEKEARAIWYLVTEWDFGGIA